MARCMKVETGHARNQRRSLALAIGLFLFSIYLFSYRGGFHSVDEVSMFAVTESLVKFGQVNTDQVAWTQWTTSQAEAQGFFGRDGHVYSKKGLALSLAQAPLYWLALYAPGLGMLQTVSLLNAAVTAVTGLLLFMFIRRLGFPQAVAVIAALLFGTATISFIYAKYLFSEPLAGLFLLLAAYMLFAYRQEAGLRHVILAGLAAGLAVLTRANNLFLLPVYGLYLLWILWDSRPSPRAAGETSREPTGLGRWLVGLALPLAVFGAAVGVVGLGLLGYNALRSGNPLQTGYDLTLFSPNILLGLYKLLFSPLRGLFIYSPLLLLSLPGWWLLQRRRPAEAWLMAGLVLVTVGLFSAWSSGEGLSWGSRFLVPVVPFLVISLAPLLKQIIDPANAGADEPGQDGPRAAIMVVRLLFYPLLLVSLLIQVLGVAINPWVFLARLQTEFGGEFFLENTAALYDFRYSQITGQIQAWSRTNADLAWWRWGFDFMAFGLSLGLVLFCGWLLYRAAGPAGKLKPALLYAAIPLTVIISYALLARYYLTDRQFGPPDDGYTLALRTAAGQADRDDRILTVAPYHYHVPMNRFKARRPLIGFAQGNWPPPDSALPLLQHAAAGANTWLVTVGFQPAAAANTAERWLALNAFKAGEEWLPDEVRLVRYGLAQPAVTRPAAATLDGRFRLVEAKTIETFWPGQVLPVEIVWQSLAATQTNYQVFLQLLAADGRLAAQHDGPPNGGYTPTSTWAAGQETITRQGLALPPDLAPGRYRLIAGLYDPASGLRLAVNAQRDFIELGPVTINGQP